MMIWLPTFEQVILLHSKLIAKTGGCDGVREAGLIESALARASASFGGVEAHPGILGKAAAAGCGLAQNHGFIDGNKRIGIAVMLLILRRNNVSLRYTQDELINLGLSIAQGTMDVPDVEAWLTSHLAAPDAN